MSFKRYDYYLEWYGKDVNDSVLIGLPIEVNDTFDIKMLNTFFGIKVRGLPVKRINIIVNWSINEMYNAMRDKFLKALGGIFKWVMKSTRKGWRKKEILGLG